MQIKIRHIGNSRGVLLPKPLLVRAGLDKASAVEAVAENGAIVLRKSARTPRAGWAEAAARLAGQSGDEWLMGEFGHEGDAVLNW